MSYCRSIFNALLLLLITPGLAIHTKVEIRAPIESYEEELDAYAQMQQGLLVTYDGFLKLLSDIENDQIEKRYALNDLDQINHFLISCARQGLLPSDDVAEFEADVDELLSTTASYSEFSLWTDSNWSIVPTISYGPTQAILCKSWVNKAWKGTKKWVKKNKKPIIIVAAIGTAAALTLGIAAAVASSAAAGAAAAGSSSDHKDKESKAPNPIPFPSDGSSNQSSAIQSTIESEMLSFKEVIDREQFLNPKNTDLSIEENGKILRDAFAHQSFEAFQRQASSNPQFNNELREIRPSKNPGAIEINFSPDGSGYSIRNPDLGVEGDLYRLRGERALELHSYDQAIHDFGKVIELDPNNHEAYLDRATAYLKTGEYERSLADYQQYTSQKSEPLKYAFDFSTAFTTGLAKGVMESGCQLGSFARDAIIHPIDTAAEVAQALTSLSKLVYSQEWKEIAETLAPEVCEIATNWDTFSPKEQVNHAGYILGKYGADIFIPGASAKVLSKGVKGTKELASACKSLKKAEKTLALETLASKSSTLEKSAPQLHTVERAAFSTTPNIVERSAINLERLAEAGKVMDRAGYTVAGRALTKHSYREGSIFPKPKGNPSQVNAHGQTILEEILNDPGNRILYTEAGDLEIYAPNGRGAFFRTDGRFRGFIEAQYE